MPVMNLGEIPLFAMLKGRLGHLNQRQQVLAQNVANADTPGYRPNDLKPFSFRAQLQAAAAPSAPKATHPGHLAGTVARPGPSKTVSAADSETTLDGNAVVLEEQMMKLTEARMNHDAAISFYQKSLGLLRMAARPPSKG